MKIRHSAAGGQEKIELQMTPMIDIVFLLLIFFIMTFKIVSLEGDFNMKMPAQAPSEDFSQVPIPPIRVRLAAAADGRLAGIQMGEQVLDSFDTLHNELIAIVGPERGPGSAADTIEIELDFDPQLHYRHVIAAITAISGHVDAENRVVKLIDKIHLATPPEE